MKKMYKNNKNESFKFEALCGIKKLRNLKKYDRSG